MTSLCASNSPQRSAAVWSGGAIWCAMAVSLAAAGCGGTQRAPDGDRSSVHEPPAATAEPSPGGPKPVADPRTPIERRRDAACEQLAPKITACAVEDTRAKLAAGKIDQRQFDSDTAPAVQRKNTEEFEHACKRASYSSRQIRVLEVCLHEEPQCRPLLDCLGHLSDRVPAKGNGR